MICELGFQGCEVIAEDTVDDSGEAVPVCAWCQRRWNERYGLDTRDDAYERAAAKARGNDFEETDGKDWT